MEKAHNIPQLAQAGAVKALPPLPSSLNLNPIALQEFPRIDWGSVGCGGYVCLCARALVSEALSVGSVGK